MAKGDNMSGKRAWLRNVHWRREVILIAQAVAETCLIAPWLVLFLAMGRSVQSEHVAGACLALILGTLYLSRVMETLDVSVWIQRGLILSLIVGLSAWTLRMLTFSGPQWEGRDWRYALLDLNVWAYLAPDIVIVVLSVTWLCWRGLRLAGRPLSVRGAAMRFQVGVLVLALLAMVSTPRESMAFVSAFFFSQLLAVALTRVETISYASGGRRLPSSGWWLTVLLGSTGIVILVAGVVSAAALGLPLDMLFFWLVPFIVLITLPLFVITLPFMGLLQDLLKMLLSGALLVINSLMAFIQQVQDIMRQMIHFTPPPFIHTVLRVIGYGIVILVILLVMAVVIQVARMVGGRRAAREDKEDEQHESIWSSRDLLRKLRARLRDRLAKLKSLAGIMERLGAGGLFAALTIRRIYAQTVRLAASHGYPRPASHTPYEHLATLRQAFPGCEADLGQITEAYVGVHYGELPEQADALAEIRAAFERVKEVERLGNKGNGQVAA
jgi:hypothetical protein